MLLGKLQHIYKVLTIYKIYSFAFCSCFPFPHWLYASFSDLHILISVEKVIITMFKTIGMHNFSQVFANQIMHLFYMLYAYGFIVLIVFFFSFLSHVCVRVLHMNVILETWAHFVAFCINHQCWVFCSLAEINSVFFSFFQSNMLLWIDDTKLNFHH